ncbi:MAG: T9SS type A sorting domain-containing protein [Flavobacterium sp.]|nr:T9SS type A sorting domain-containing protein [Flavobacterium sp.]
MKKRLLYLVLPMLFTALSINAQTKVWDFGANPMGAGFTDMITVANQTTCALFPAGSLTGGVEAGHQVSALTASATFGTLVINTFLGDRWRSDNASLVLYDQTLNNTLGGSAVTPVFVGATKSGRLAFNGTGTAIRRYFTITLTAGQTVTIYWKSNITTAGSLTVTVPGGSAVSTSLAYNATAATSEMRQSKLTADVAGAYTIGDYVGKMETYRIYDADVNAAINLSALSTNNFDKGASLDIFSIKNQVYVSNIISATQINVYSITGSLVKSVKAAGNANFELSTGIYIVNAKSADGEKSVKLIVQ